MNGILTAPVRVPARLIVARVADRWTPVLLTLLMLALMASITAIEVLSALLVVAVGLTALDPARRERLDAPLLLPMAAFGLATLLSAAAASQPSIAFFESKSLVFLALFFAAVNGFRSPDQIERTLTWLFVAVAVASAYAIVQTWACSSGGELPAWMGRALRVRLEACRAVPPFRAKGFFSIYMTLGGSLLVALSLILSMLTRGGRVAWGPLVSGALAVVTLGLTYSRNAWVGLAVAIGVLAALTRRTLLVVPVLLAVVVVLVVPSALATRMRSMVDPSDPTARERLYMWSAGLRMAADAPLLGLGPGGVRAHYPEYRDPRAIRPRTGHLHNNLVQIVAERGALGLVTWLAIWIAFFVQAGRIYRTLPPTRGAPRAMVAGSIAAVAGFLVAGLFEYNFGDSEVIDLVWIVMALPFVCRREARATEAPRVQADQA